MNNKDFSSLITISKFAVFLCAALVIFGNIGMFSSMPIIVNDPMTAQTHIDFIHIIYYAGFNFMFIGFLGYLFISLKHYQQQMKLYLARH